MNIQDSLEKFGLQANGNQLLKFEKYLVLIKEWNTKINITSITNDDEIISKHFIDSLSSGIAIKYSDQRIVDIGTGAGFPGLPLKILFPDLDIVFIDSSTKKANILSNICSELNIKNYSIINDTISRLGQDPKYREKFDICVCRALASVKEIVELGIPFLRIFGELVIYKGPGVELEVENSLDTLKQLYAKITKNIDISLPFTDFKRKIVIVEKIWKTPQKYPRRADKIKSKNI